MRALSLCSGYGGLEMGLELAGVPVDLASYAEFDKYASKVMAEHHPKVRNLGDIKKVRWHHHWTSFLDFGDIDILTAGYPCQPFSQAGKRLGTDDPRHLWPYVAEAVRHLRPRHVFLENVRGHVTKGLPQVLADLADLGYVGSWGCFRASEVGACHRRERVFIVASDAAGVATNASGERVGEHAGGASSEEAGAQGDHFARRTGTGWTAPHPDREPFTVGTQRDGGSAQPGLAAPFGDDAGGRGEPAPDASDIGCERVGESRGRWCGSPHHREPIDWGKFGPAIECWELVLGRPAPNPTEGDKHRLNPVFVEWMMGLPEGHVTGVDGISRTQQMKILGNGVVPQQAAYAWHHLYPVTGI